MNEEMILNKLRKMLVLESKKMTQVDEPFFDVEDYISEVEELCRKENISVVELSENVDSIIETLDKSSIVMHPLKAIQRLKVYNGRIIFCKIGWAGDYEGSLDDQPQGGGSFNNLNIGHESLNFKADKGILYGYVQLSNRGKPSNIKIENIDLDFKNKDSIDNVLVVWVATNPINKEYNIVGWYRNATVYRMPQECEENSDRYLFFSKQTPVGTNNQKFNLSERTSYRISTGEEDATLIQENDRKYKIRKARKSGDGGMGSQSSLWYASESGDTVLDVVQYIYDSNTNYESLFGKIESEMLVGEEKERLVKQRSNQGVFRNKMIGKYKKCCLCGVKQVDLLIASHIKPWSKSNKFEKLDTNNGLLLCPNHDSLFDKGLISFTDEGEILISKSLEVESRIFLNVNAHMYIEIHNEMKKYLKFHRENIFKEL